MSRIHEGLDDPGFPMPTGITTAVVCNKTGKLALDSVCALDGSAHSEYYAEGTVPKEYCNGVHSFGTQQLYVCALTGQVATESCPYKVPTASVNPALGFCPHSVDAATAAAAAQNAALQQSINDANAAAAAAAAALQQQLMSGVQ